MDCDTKNDYIKTKEQIFSQEFNSIFNNCQGINDDNKIIYKYKPLINKLQNVPPEKVYPPPLVKRLNIELERLNKCN